MTLGNKETGELYKGLTRPASRSSPMSWDEPCRFLLPSPFTHLRGGPFSFGFRQENPPLARRGCGRKQHSDKIHFPLGRREVGAGPFYGAIEELPPK